MTSPGKSADLSLKPILRQQETQCFFLAYFDPEVATTIALTYWPMRAINLSKLSVWYCRISVSVPTMKGGPSRGSTGFLHTIDPKNEKMRKMRVFRHLQAYQLICDKPAWEIA